MGLLAEAFVHPSAQDLAEHCVACGGATQSDLCAASIDSAFVLTFQEFNLKHVLERGQALLASGGQVRLGCLLPRVQINRISIFPVNVNAFNSSLICPGVQRSGRSIPDTATEA